MNERPGLAGRIVVAFLRSAIFPVLGISLGISIKQVMTHGNWLPVTVVGGIIAVALVIWILRLIDAFREEKERRRV